MNAIDTVKPIRLPDVLMLPCAGSAPGSTVYFKATLKIDSAERVHRMIVVNDAIRQAAASLLQGAQEQADQAALADAQLYAAGTVAYNAEPGRRTNAALQVAIERVESLQQLANGSSDLGPRGGIDVYTWRSLLRHFGMSIDTGASEGPTA